MPKPRVLLLCGGQSQEHDVSLSSARSVMSASGDQFDITPLVISKTGQLLNNNQSQNILQNNNASPALTTNSGLQNIDQQAFDVVFPLLHGPYGEDGSVQGMLKLMGLPFVGSDVLGSAVGMDKLMMKAVFHAHNLPQLEYRAVKRSDWQTTPDAVITELMTLDYPMFVKPANLGSSVGISKATDEPSLRAALTEAAQHDRRIIVEQGLEGARELEIGVLGNDNPQVSPVGEIAFQTDFYDYATKYTEGCAALSIPANIPESIKQQCQTLAKQAFSAIDAAGISRVDFFLSKDNQLYLNEINTMPGFTTTSMYPKLWEAAGLPYDQLIKRLIELALENR